jgi:hypothetical protein
VLGRAAGLPPLDSNYGSNKGRSARYAAIHRRAPAGRGGWVQDRPNRGRSRRLPRDDPVRGEAQRQTAVRHAPQEPHAARVRIPSPKRSSPASNRLFRSARRCRSAASLARSSSFMPPNPVDLGTRSCHQNPWLPDYQVLGEVGLRGGTDLGTARSTSLLSRCRCKRMTDLSSVAERVGFEPTVRFPAHTLSKRAP